MTISSRLAGNLRAKQLRVTGFVRPETAPWHVVSADGVLLSGHATEEAARAKADAVNESRPGAVRVVRK